MAPFCPDAFHQGESGQNHRLIARAQRIHPLLALGCRPWRSLSNPWLVNSQKHMIESLGRVFLNLLNPSPPHPRNGFVGGRVCVGCADRVWLPQMNSKLSAVRSGAPLRMTNDATIAKAFV